MGDYGAYWEAFDTIPGWLAFDDAATIAALLAEQRKQALTGDLLEIGTYQGKCAILLGYWGSAGESVVVCDVFGPDPYDDGQEAGLARYEGLDVKQFWEQWNRFHDYPPRVIVGPSSRLGALLTNPVRFAHVDGSHAYRAVREDIATVLAHSVKGAVIALDDYREPHTPGTACAVWQAVTQGELHPFLLTEFKLYATTDADSQREWLAACGGMDTCTHRIAGMDVARLLPKPNEHLPD